MQKESGMHALIVKVFAEPDARLSSICHRGLSHLDAGLDFTSIVMPGTRSLEPTLAPRDLGIQSGISS